MAGLKIDPGLVAGYAKSLTAGADRLGGQADTLKDTTLGNDAFGDLGRQVKTAESYLRAATTLRDQLTRAVATLHAASESLTEVAKRFQTGEEDTAHTLKHAEKR